MSRPVTISFDELKTLAATGLPLAEHSAAVAPGGIFVAKQAAKEGATGGEAYIEAVVAKGVRYVVAHNQAVTPDGDYALCLSDNPRQALAHLAAARFGTMESPMAVIGVTGTNGKTTICYLLEQLLTALGRKVGVLGTVSYRYPGFELPAPLTTPDALTTHALLADMAKAGCQFAVMEVSSHALDQDRAAAIPFSCAVFTNLTQDHLDYHHDFQTYFAAKAKLFTQLPKADKACVINADDQGGRRLLAGLPTSLAYGLAPVAHTGPVLQGSLLGETMQGLELRLEYAGEALELRSPLVGRHNAENLLAVAGAALSLGFNLADMAALSGCFGAPGRLERVGKFTDRAIFVDYAHTPDALENVCQALRALDFKRLLVVFGCGGDRDRTKRPLMGQAVAKYADVAFLTSDNPRSENPVAILDDIRPGLRDCPQVLETPDRREAIAKALSMLKPGDALLVAGKGHERTQQIGSVKYPFHDPSVILELLS